MFFLSQGFLPRPSAPFPCCCSGLRRQGDKDALKALVAANVLSLETRVDRASGKPAVYTRPASPLYALAFAKIVGDAEFAARMQRHCVDVDVTEVNDKIGALEGELFRLAQSMARGAGAETRRAQLDEELRVLARECERLKRNAPPEYPSAEL